MKVLTSIFALVTLALTTSGANTPLGQSDVDRIVDSETLLYMHHEDVQMSIDGLKSRGATDSMIAEAMCRVLRRDCNAGVDEEGCVKANSALYWLEQIGDGNQQTNFLYVASNATNNFAAKAAKAFYRRCGDKTKFIGEADKLLDRPGMPYMKSSIWGCLEKESEGENSERVARLAEKHLKIGDPGLLHADAILVKSKAGYAKSKERIELLRKAVSASEKDKSKSAVREGLQKRIKEAGQE